VLFKTTASLRQWNDPGRIKHREYNRIYARVSSALPPTSCGVVLDRHLYRSSDVFAATYLMSIFEADRAVILERIGQFALYTRNHRILPFPEQKINSQNAILSLGRLQAGRPFVFAVDTPDSPPLQLQACGE
jgi:hypothetical protein